jgi:hypothetical protein
VSVGALLRRVWRGLTSALVSSACIAMMAFVFLICADNKHFQGTGVSVPSVRAVLLGTAKPFQDAAHGRQESHVRIQNSLSGIFASWCDLQASHAVVCESASVSCSNRRVEATVKMKVKTVSTARCITRRTQSFHRG